MVVRGKFRYDPETGEMERLWARIGWQPVPGKVGNHGYRVMSFEGYPTLYHRVAWWIMTGAWPECIDHLNRNRQDNRWSNLKDVGYTDNNLNRAMNVNNTSGVRGVSFRKASGKWIPHITVDRRVLWLGSYENFEDAVAVRKAAEVKYFGKELT